MLIDKLVQKCDKNIDGNKMVHNTTLNDYERASESCTLHIIINHNVHNNYEHWYCMYLFLLAYNKKLL